PRFPRFRRGAQFGVHDSAVRGSVTRQREQGSVPPGRCGLDPDECGPGGSRLDGERFRPQGVAGARECRVGGCDRAPGRSTGGRVPAASFAGGRVRGGSPLRPGHIAARFRRSPALGGHRGHRGRSPGRLADRVGGSRDRRPRMTAVQTLSPAARALWGDLGKIRAPRGTTLNARSWATEAPLRMLLNNLDADVAERPEELVVYGGSGKAARDHDALRALVRSLLRLGEDETLLVQSGKPVGVFRTHPEGARVVIANSLLVPRWATWDEFRRLETLGLTMFGQMTAGSWIYIGTQGILQGTYQTF